MESSSGELRVNIRLFRSRFPTHRAFVNRVIWPRTIPQGPFSNLWGPAGITNPTLVR
jgi:hypothetical protein